LIQKFWEELAGSTVGCGEYPLGELIGSTEWSAVYRTSMGEASTVLKLIAADRAAPESRLAEHPGIVRLMATGDCDVGGLPFRYFVMEAADENLAAVIRTRALTPEEAREMTRKQGAIVIQQLPDISKQQPNLDPKRDIHAGPNGAAPGANGAAPGGPAGGKTGAGSTKPDTTEPGKTGPTGIGTTPILPTGQ
jgi:hypothetical protein